MSSSTNSAPKNPLVRLAERIHELLDEDKRIGYPEEKPDVEKESFGWLFPAQQILLDYVLREETRIVVQLGAYLGKTTIFIAEQAPKALIFVIDPWDNDILKNEPSLNKNFANIDLFDRVEFYPTFLCNTWNLAAKTQEDGRLLGVIPMRMSFEEGIRVLKALELRPDVLYWEGFPHEDGVFQTLQCVNKAFPGVVIVGDGYNYPEVQKGLERASSEIFKRKPFVELGKCWTFARVTPNMMLKDLRARYQATENRAERTVLSGAISKASFKDLLSGLKSKTDERKREEAEERLRRRKEEEEERDRLVREQERRESGEESRSYKQQQQQQQRHRHDEVGGRRGGAMNARGGRRGGGRRGGGRGRGRSSPGLMPTPKPEREKRSRSASSDEAESRFDRRRRREEDVDVEGDEAAPVSESEDQQEEENLRGWG